MDQSKIDTSTAIALPQAEAQRIEAERGAHLGYMLLTVISLWGISTLSFGLPGLVLPAVIMAPLCLVAITLMLRGK